MNDDPLPVTLENVPVATFDAAVTGDAQVAGLLGWVWDEAIDQLDGGAAAPCHQP